MKRAEEMSAGMGYERYIDNAKSTSEKGVYGPLGINSLYDGFKNIEFVKLKYEDIAQDYYIGYHGRAEAKIYAALTEEFRRIACRIANNDTITPSRAINEIITAFAYEMLRRRLIFAAVELGYLDSR